MDVIAACQPSKLDDRERNPDGAAARVAQLVEHSSCKAGVGASSASAG